MNYVVVGLDGSVTARAAFAEALQQAEWRGIDVAAVHVVHFPVVNAYTMGYLDADVLREAAAEWLAKELAILEADFPDGFPVRVLPRARVGHYGSELIAVANGNEEASADLVVLGSRGLGGFKGLLLGSVSTYAIHHAPCQVLIVPPVGEAAEGSDELTDAEALLPTG